MVKARNTSGVFSPFFYTFHLSCTTHTTTGDRRRPEPGSIDVVSFRHISPVSLRLSPSISVSLCLSLSLFLSLSLSLCLCLSLCFSVSLSLYVSVSLSRQFAVEYCIKFEPRVFCCFGCQATILLLIKSSGWQKKYKSDRLISVLTRSCGGK